MRNLQHTSVRQGGLGNFCTCRNLASKSWFLLNPLKPSLFRVQDLAFNSMRRSTKSPTKRAGKATSADNDESMAAWLLHIAADANAHTKDALVAGGAVYCRVVRAVLRSEVGYQSSFPLIY